MARKATFTEQQYTAGSLVVLDIALIQRVNSSHIAATRCSFASCSQQALTLFFTPGNDVTHITLCLSTMRGFGSPCQALSIVAETAMHGCHPVTHVSTCAAIESNTLQLTGALA